MLFLIIYFSIGMLVAMAVILWGNDESTKDIPVTRGEVLFMIFFGPLLILSSVVNAMAGMTTKKKEKRKRGE